MTAELNDGKNAQVEAVATVGGVLTDLVELAERMPVPPDQAEATARILDRLAEEITEAAGMVRAAHSELARREQRWQPPGTSSPQPTMRSGCS
jgi:hypothetical protein